ncbi:flippase [Kocuria oceani]|uniref:flippase n=1 Tax=Kocuria oceani TaxID=988827 RepID=UPI004035E881
MGTKSGRLDSLGLLFDSFLRMGLAFGVSVLIARQYGPENLGIISAATALAILVIGFSNLGLNAALVHEFIERPSQAATLLCTVTIGKLAAGFILLASLISGAYLWHEKHNHLTLAVVVACGFLFTCLDTVESFYHSQSQFKRLVAIRAFAIVASTCIKLFMISFGLDLLYLAVGFAFDYLLLYLLPAVWLFFLKQSGAMLIEGAWVVNFRMLGNLLRRTWPIILSGGFAQVNLRADVIILAAVAGPTQAGLYAAAAKLSDAWAMAAAAIVSANYPALARSSMESCETYAEQLSSLLRKLLWMAAGGAVAIYLTAPYIINIVYGTEYSEASKVLAIHIVGGGFLFLRAVVDRWIIVEKILKFSMISQALGATVNVSLNLLLIPSMGAVGSAWASVASYAVGSFLFLALTARTRPMLAMVCLSVFPRRFFAKKRVQLAKRMMAMRSDRVSV